MQPKYHTLYELVAMIDEPNRSRIMKLIKANRPTLLTAYGSVHNHQSWSPGGWWDHMKEVMNLAVVLYPTLNSLRPLPFALSDALLVLFIHDIEKPWKYERGEDGQMRHKGKIMQTKCGQQKFRMDLAGVYGIELTAEHVNGVKYAEGELADYSNRQRVMGPLAAFVHMCDNPSARLWPDYPYEKSDPWKGAHRVASDEGVEEAEYLARFKENAPHIIADMLEARKTY